MLGADTCFCQVIHNRAMNPFDLKGRAALVTGGNGGIGLGMALGLARAGARVAIGGGGGAQKTRPREQTRGRGGGLPGGGGAWGGLRGPVGVAARERRGPPRPG